MFIITAKEWRRERIQDCLGRFELKSVIDLDTYKELVSEVKRQTKPDPHSRDGWYQIHSTYYDSPGLNAYLDRLDGKEDRSKLRLRTYSDPFYPKIISNAHCEIKEKRGALTLKKRLMLPVKFAENLFNGEIPEGLENIVDKEVAEEIATRVKDNKLIPSSNVAYLRQAFIGGGYYPDLRITFDTELYGCKFGSKPQKLIDNDKILMEVKFNNHIPDWVIGLINKYNCLEANSSKYCLSLETDMKDVLKKISRNRK